MMKKIILIVGIFLIVFNTFAGLIISGYSPFNYLMADFSIALTVGIIWWLADSNLSGGMKIGLSSLFTVTGFVRIICTMVMPATWENNILILVAMGILILEFACMAVSLFVDKK